MAAYFPTASEKARDLCEEIDNVDLVWRSDTHVKGCVVTQQSKLSYGSLLLRVGGEHGSLVVLRTLRFLLAWHTPTTNADAKAEYAYYNAVLNMVRAYIVQRVRIALRFRKHVVIRSYSDDSSL